MKMMMCITTYCVFYRCGALTVGDQILSIDETVIENTAFTPDDVMDILNANTNRGYTQIQILPAYTMTRKGRNIQVL